MFVWQLHYALLKGAFCYADVRDQVRFKNPRTCLPRSGFVQRSFCTGAGGVTPQVANRLADQDRMQRYRMPVRCGHLLYSEVSHSEDELRKSRI
jgi:hypothetical protein